MAFRQELDYPPYRRLALFQLSGNVEKNTEAAAHRVAAKCRELIEKRSDYFAEVAVLGPVSAPVAKVKGKHRWQLLLKSSKVAPLLKAGGELVNWGHTELRGSGVSLTVDVDPISLI